MKERPILFSGPMVRAILDGRKTQTRRVVKPQPKGVEGATWLSAAGQFAPCRDELCRGCLDQIGPYIRCPYGQPGDRLWVKETWGLHRHYDFTCWHRDSIRGRDRDDVNMSWEVAYGADARSPYDHWRPSIFMPRWASRITLEIVGVRIERLQDITEADARAEGLYCDEGRHTFGWHADGDTARHNAPTHAYCALWEQINGPGSWAANPWVWCVEFRRAEEDV